MPGRAHAEHNEELCDLLILDGKFDDWVVTTAFYASIHLVDHQMFPRVIGNEPRFDNFKQYVNRKNPPIPKHEVRRNLVADYLPGCSGAFNWLMDNCFNARYNDYRVPADYSKRARGCLDSIKKHCPKS